MVVERVEQRQVQDRRHGPGLLIAEPTPPDAVLIGRGPAVGAGHDLHPVGTQGEQFSGPAIDLDRFDVSIAGHEEVPVDPVEEAHPAFARIRPGEQSQQGMGILGAG